MLETYAQYVLLVGAILFLVMLAQKLKIAYPIVLVMSELAWCLFSQQALKDCGHCGRQKPHE